MASPLSSSSSASTPSEPWILGDFKIEDTPEATKRVLDYLGRRPRVLYKNKEEGEKILARLRAIDLTKAELDSFQWEAYTMIQPMFPDYFSSLFERQPRIPLTFNGNTIEVEKNRLIQRSKVLQEHVASGIPINLDEHQGISADTKKEFLRYLLSGTLHIDSADPFELLRLDALYSVRGLQRWLATHLEKSLAEETALKIFKAALNYDIRALSEVCMFFVYYYPELLAYRDPLGASFRSPAEILAEAPWEKSSNLEKVLESLQILKNEGGTLSYQFPGASPLDITIADWSKDNSKLINELCRWVDLRLVLRDTCHDSEGLKNLLISIPFLKKLSIEWNDKIEYVIGFDLKILSCKYCDEIARIIAPEAVVVSAYKCPALKTENIHASKGCDIDNS